jgi:hypothetical protein
MPEDLRYTLLSDGSSDRALLPILSWLLVEQGVRLSIQPAWADLRRLPRPPRPLADRVRTSLDLYPCDLLFVHRDAEGEGYAARKREIQEALSGTAPAVCVVPVRMTEAWLLLDEAAIRRAAGNPSGQEELQIPPPADLEALPDPKSLLHGLLREASRSSSRLRWKGG